ncbi:MAG UNVERIFIED_CONTAM: hypothetical protein LVR18_36610 [Planctomycetaceae bacterium]
MSRSVQRETRSRSQMQSLKCHRLRRIHVATTQQVMQHQHRCHQLPTQLRQPGSLTEDWRPPSTPSQRPIQPQLKPRQHSLTKQPPILKLRHPLGTHMTELQTAPATADPMRSDRRLSSPSAVTIRSPSSSRTNRSAESSSSSDEVTSSHGP